jgi:penicillin G amidase
MVTADRSAEVRYHQVLWIPKANPDEVLFLPVNMTRGTENHIVVLKPSGLKGVDVRQAGHSALVVPEGATDPHYQDQMELYRDFEHVFCSAS